jgi:hypothetical protein
VGDQPLVTLFVRSWFRLDSSLIWCWKSAFRVVTKPRTAIMED